MCETLQCLERKSIVLEVDFSASYIEPPLIAELEELKEQTLQDMVKF